MSLLGHPGLWAVILLFLLLLWRSTFLVSPQAMPWYQQCKQLFQSRRRFRPKGATGPEKQEFDITVGFPKLIAKGREACFVVQLCQPEKTPEALGRLKEMFGESFDVEKWSALFEDGQLVRVRLSSPMFQFEDSRLIRLDAPIKTIEFLARVLDECAAGTHKIILEIFDPADDPRFDQLVNGWTFSVHVVDYAFDHIPRTLASFVSAAVALLSAVVMAVSTVLGQINAILGYTSGAGIAAISLVIIARTYSLYIKIGMRSVAGA